MIVRGKAPGTESVVDIVVEHGRVVRVTLIKKDLALILAGQTSMFAQGFLIPR